jgi:hypothetical protein
MLLLSKSGVSNHLLSTRQALGAASAPSRSEGEHHLADRETSFGNAHPLGRLSPGPASVHHLPSQIPADRRTLSLPHRQAGASHTPPLGSQLLPGGTDTALFLSTSPVDALAPNAELGRAALVGDGVSRSVCLDTGGGGEEYTRRRLTPCADNIVGTIAPSAGEPVGVSCCHSNLRVDLSLANAEQRPLDDQTSPTQSLLRRCASNFGGAVSVPLDAPAMRASLDDDDFSAGCSHYTASTSLERMSPDSSMRETTQANSFRVRTTSRAQRGHLFGPSDGSCLADQSDESRSFSSQYAPQTTQAVIQTAPNSTGKGFGTAGIGGSTLAGDEFGGANLGSIGGSSVSDLRSQMEMASLDVCSGEDDASEADSVAAARVHLGIVLGAGAQDLRIQGLRDAEPWGLSSQRPERFSDDEDEVLTSVDHSQSSRDFDDVHGAIESPDTSAESGRGWQRSRCQTPHHSPSRPVPSSPKLSSPRVGTPGRDYLAEPASCGCCTAYNPSSYAGDGRVQGAVESSESCSGWQQCGCASRHVGAAASVVDHTTLDNVEGSSAAAPVPARSSEGKPRKQALPGGPGGLPQRLVCADGMNVGSFVGSPSSASIAEPADGELSTEAPRLSTSAAALGAVRPEETSTQAGEASGLYSTWFGVMGCDHNGCADVVHSEKNGNGHGHVDACYSGIYSSGGAVYNSAPWEGGDQTGHAERRDPRGVPSAANFGRCPADDLGVVDDVATAGSIGSVDEATGGPARREWGHAARSAVPMPSEASASEAVGGGVRVAESSCQQAREGEIDSLQTPSTELASRAEQDGVNRSHHAELHTAACDYSQTPLDGAQHGVSFLGTSSQHNALASSGYVGIAGSLTTTPSLSMSSQSARLYTPPVRHLVGGARRDAHGHLGAGRQRTADRTGLSGGVARFHAGIGKRWLCYGVVEFHAGIGKRRLCSGSGWQSVGSRIGTDTLIAAMFSLPIIHPGRSPLPLALRSLCVGVNPL